MGRIYLEPEVEAYPRGRDILARFPRAERVPVASRWRIPDLRDADPADWLARKRDTLMLGVKRGLQCRPNGRSADSIAPSTSNGRDASRRRCPRHTAPASIDAPVPTWSPGSTTAPGAV